ncbi:MAG: SprT family zinc-dependent metalloprotease [Alphaproteobacteria bacterium]
MAGMTVLRIDGRDVEVAIRRSARARRIAIRVDPAIGGAELVLPSRVGEAAGMSFLKERAGWIAARLAALPDGIPFGDGAMIPYRGAVHHIVHAPAARRGVWVDGNRICVSGQEKHLPRRLHDWLRRDAHAAIAPVVAEKTALLGRRAGKISIRGQRSRWGSCAANGNLSFNWRLILAPADVLEYVVAHEVGHLTEANHSPAFWAVVDRLCPHAQSGRRWLRENGADLFRYG